MRERTESYAADTSPAKNTPPSARLLATVVSLVAGLGSDRPTIPADGATVATINWAGAANPVALTVNGAAQSLATALDATSGLRFVDFEVTAAQTGPIEISDGTSTLTIQAV